MFALFIYGYEHFFLINNCVNFNAIYYKSREAKYIYMYLKLV